MSWRSLSDRQNLGKNTSKPNVLPGWGLDFNTGDFILIFFVLAVLPVFTVSSKKDETSKCFQKIVGPPTLRKKQKLRRKSSLTWAALKRCAQNPHCWSYIRMQSHLLAFHLSLSLSLDACVFVFKHQNGDKVSLREKSVSLYCDFTTISMSVSTLASF